MVHKIVKNWKHSTALIFVMNEDDILVFSPTFHDTPMFPTAMLRRIPQHYKRYRHGPEKLPVDRQKWCHQMVQYFAIAAHLFLPFLAAVWLDTAQKLSCRFRTPNSAYTVRDAEIVDLSTVV